MLTVSGLGAACSLDTSLDPGTCNYQTQAQLQAAMSYYVGAEPRNPVQCEKFWRNRIDAEEAQGIGV